jgi:hypothetical protein
MTTLLWFNIIIQTSIKPKEGVMDAAALQNADAALKEF